MASSTTELDIPAPLLNKLAMVRRRKIFVGIGVAVLIALAVLVAAMTGAMFIDWMFTLFEPTWRRVLLMVAIFAAFATLVLGAMGTIRRTRALTSIALDIDREVPQLEERWSTVTEISSRENDGPANFHPVMMNHVTEEALEWAPQVNPRNVVTWQNLRRPLGVLAGIGVVLLGAMLLDWRQTAVLIGRFWAPSSKISMTTIDGVEDVVVARGEELAINAELNGRTVDEAAIFLRPKASEQQRQILFPRGDAPQTVRFRQRAAEESFDYRIRAGDGQSDWHAVVVANRPELSAVTVKITPPEYTRRENRELRELPEKLSVIEGSVFEVALRAEETLRSMKLQLGDEKVVELKADSDGWYRWKRDLDESFVLTPLLTEPNGLQNDNPPICRVDVLADQAPEVRIITPNDEIAVRPDDSIDIEFEAKDDFGISHAELVVYDESDLDSDGEPKEIMTVDIPLDLADGQKEVTGNVQLDLSKFNLEDGESISYAVRVHDTREMSSDRQANASLASNSNNPSGDAEPQEGNASQQDMASSAAASEADSETGQNEGAVAANESDSGNDSTNAEVSDDSAFPGDDQVASAEPSANASTPPGNTDPSKNAAGDNEMSNSAQSGSPQGQPSNSVASSQPNGSPSNGNSQQSNSAQSGQSNSQSSQSNASAGQPQQNNQSPSSSGGSPNQSSMASAQNSDNQNSSSSSNRPGDNMTRRSLDVGNSQAGSSNRMSLTVDRWAGRFDGQSREKMEMAIAPVIEKIDQQLEKAEGSSRGLLDGIEAGVSWQDPQAEQLEKADEALANAVQLIDDLSLKTEETPYAFVGLTLVDISNSQISPAREEFWNAKQSEAPERAEQIRDGWRYVQRARQLLAALSKQYEKVRRDYQLAESVERIKEMYQVYIENAHALLASGGVDDLGGLQRKMAEFELDDEYLARLKEVLEMRQELMAEFARMLSDDPRLLRRYMDRLRNRTKTLRYELAELTDRQKALAREVAAHHSVEEKDRESLNRTILKQKLLQVEAISTSIAELDERFRIWLPLDIEIEDGSLAEARDLTEDIAASSRELLSAANSFGNERNGSAKDSENLKSIGRQAAQLTRKLDSLDAALRRVSIEDDRQDLADHQTRRIVETQKIMSQMDSWVQKIKELARGNYHLAAEIEQHELTADSALLAGKLADIETQLAGSLQTDSGSLPEPIAEKAQELLATLDEEVAINQLSAVYALSEEKLDSAISRQNQAIAGMEKAEKLLQELLTMAITEMDKLPVQDPIASALEDPTLDELLAALEQELDSADDLGIPPRPSNLNVIGDMMMPGRGQQGQGSGMMGMGMQLGMANQQLRKMFEKAYQEALGRALKEKRVTRSSAAKHLRRLPNRSPKRWLVGSKLGDELLQGSDKMAPEQYRQAIEQYFDQISNLQDDSADTEN